MKHFCLSWYLLLGWVGLTLWSATTLQAGSGRPTSRFFAPRETGGKDVHWTATQDERGVMYFGSDVVLSFDGERWRQDTVAQSYGVRALATAPGGRLWVAAVNEVGYFERTSSGNLSPYHSLVDQLPAGTGDLGDVWHVFAHGNGAVFVTSTLVLIWDGAAFTTHALPGSRRLAATLWKGRIYVSHTTRGLWVVEGRALQPVLPPGALQEAGALWVEQQAEGWLLATKDGLLKYDGQASTPWAAEASDFIRRNIMTTVCRLPGGELAIGTLNGGVAIVGLDGAITQTLTREAGLQSNTVMFLFVDRDGALWVTSSAGLTRIPLSQGAQFFDEQEGLAGKPCNRITQFGEDILVATDDGAFSFNTSPQAPARFARVPALAAYFYDLLGADDGVYVAGYRGVYRWNRGELATVFATRSDVLMLRASPSTPGTYFFAHDNELIKLSLGAGGTATSTDLLRLPDSAQTVAEDSTGNLWIGTRSRGVYVLPAGAASVDLQTGKTAEIASVERGVVARAGGFVAVCSPRGIELHETPQSPTILVPRSPTSGALAASNEDPSGAIWVAFNSPLEAGLRVPVIGRLTVTKGAGVWTPYAIQGLERLGEIKSLFVDRHGDLWIGGGDGLLRTRPAQLSPTQPSGAPLIQTALADGGEIKPNQSSIDFYYSALEFGRREGVRYQTKLGGVAAEWSPPSNDSHLTVAGLRDGSYEFAVRVINDAGQTGPESVLRFTVLPPWYRTGVAYGAWCFLVLAGFFGVLQWRSAYLRRQNVRLAVLVQKKTEQLEKANAAKSDFLANMSHEIRNPISGIVGLSLAMQETTLDERQRELNDSVRSCAALLATLVDDVLDFSKIEAGRIELRPAPFEIAVVLQQCVAMIAEDVRLSGGTLAIEVDPQVMSPVIGDSARVQQIVLNYLTNALKFGAGQPITVGAAPGTQGRIRLWVRDRGPGMTAAEAGSLFTKFTRLEQSRTNNIRGTGLGLAVCRLLASKMGGSVGVDSQPGEGSCFWVELPFATEAASPAPVATLAAPARPLRALIVEDIDYNATAMQAVLRKLGVGSDVATDGHQALEKLRGSFYDVAFMDWDLPGLIGTEVVARFRATEPPQRRTVIIATTAHSAEFNREACLQAGMDAFISKPFTPEKISVALRDLRGSLRAAASVEVHSRETADTATADLDLKLLRFLGDDTPQGLADQITRYLDAFDRDWQTALSLLAGDQAQEIHRAAHRLAGHASMVKFEPLMRLAAELQAHAGSNEPGKREELVASFEAEFATLKSKLDSIRASTAPV